MLVLTIWVTLIVFICGFGGLCFNSSEYETELQIYYTCSKDEPLRATCPDGCIIGGTIMAGHIPDSTEECSYKGPEEHCHNWCGGGDMELHGFKCLWHVSQCIENASMLGSPDMDCPDNFPIKSTCDYLFAKYKCIEEAHVLDICDGGSPVPSGGYIKGPEYKAGEEPVIPCSKMINIARYGKATFQILEKNMRAFVSQQLIVTWSSKMRLTCESVIVAYCQHGSVTISEEITLCADEERTVTCTSTLVFTVDGPTDVIIRYYQSHSVDERLAFVLQYAVERNPSSEPTIFPSSTKGDTSTSTGTDPSETITSDSERTPTTSADQTNGHHEDYKMHFFLTFGISLIVILIMGVVIAFLVCQVRRAQKRGRTREENSDTGNVLNNYIYDKDGIQPTQTVKMTQSALFQTGNNSHLHKEDSIVKPEIPNGHLANGYAAHANQNGKLAEQISVTDSGSSDSVMTIHM